MVFSLLNTGGICVELTVILAQKIAGLAIYIALGFLAVRLKVLTFQDSKALSTFALYFLVPCAMLDAYQYEFSMEKLVGMGVSFAASMVVVLVFALLTAALKKPMHLNVVEYTSLEYPNAGNFMLPLVAAAMEREIVLSTAMGDGLAFPHVRGVEGGGLTLALGVSKKGFVYDDAGTRVHIVFFSAIPVAVSAFYLRLMSGLSEAFSKKENRDLLLAAKTPAELWKSFMKATRYTIR